MYKIWKYFEKWQPHECDSHTHETARICLDTEIQILKYIRQMFFTKLYFFTFRLLDFLYFKTCFLFLQIYFETMRSQEDCAQTVRQLLVWDIPPRGYYFRNWSQRLAEIKKIALLKKCKREYLISATPTFRTYLHCLW